MKKPEIFTLRNLLNESARSFNALPALCLLDGKKYSYREVESISLRVASLLKGLGIRTGDKVTILSESRPEWGIVYFGITAAGFVAVPILPDFMPAQISTIIKHSDSKAVIASAKLVPKLEDDVKNLCPLLELDSTIQSLVEDANPVQTNWDSFAEPSEEDLAAILYTSGTTGRPKGVMLSHRALAYDAWASNSIVTMTPKDRLLSILPIAHAYECTVGFLTPFTYGCSVYYLDRPPAPSILLPAMKRIRPTMMLCVPLVIEKIVRNSVFPKLEAMRLPKLEFLRKLLHHLVVRIAGKKLEKAFGGKLWFLGIGGAALATDVEQFLKEAGFPYAIGYGMTEAAPLIAGMHPKKQVFRATGLPVRGISIRISETRNEHGEGEIEVKGPIVMDGYYKEPGLTKDVFTPDGWLRTGDLGVVDYMGQLFIRGRLKTMILGPSGENIYPEEIEALINSFHFVEESLVYDDKNHGVTALVQLKPDIVEKLLAEVSERMEKIKDGVKILEHKAGHLLESLKSGVNQRLAAFSRVRKLVLQTEPFEKTPSKKIKRDIYLSHK